MIMRGRTRFPVRVGTPSTGGRVRVLDRDTGRGRSGRPAIGRSRSNAPNWSGHATPQTPHATRPSVSWTVIVGSLRHSAPGKSRSSGPAPFPSSVDSSSRPQGGTPAGSAFAGSAGVASISLPTIRGFVTEPGPGGCVGLDFDVVLVAPERLGLEAGSRDGAAAWRRIKADRSASVRNQKRPVPAPPRCVGSCRS